MPSKFSTPSGGGKFVIGNDAVDQDAFVLGSGNAANLAGIDQAAGIAGRDNASNSHSYGGGRGDNLGIVCNGFRVSGGSRLPRLVVLCFCPGRLCFVHCRAGAI